MFRELEKLAAENFPSVSSGGISFLTYAGLDITTVIVFKKQSESPAGVLKISRRPGQQKLRHEFEVLSQVQKHVSAQFAATIPHALSLNNLHGLDVFALEFLQGKRKSLNWENIPGMKSFFNQIRLWLRELGKTPVPSSQTAFSRFPEARNKILALCKNHSPDPRLSEAIEEICCWDVSRPFHGIPLVVTHRDLAPSNILFQGEEMRVVDWGNSCYGYPILDWIRFVCHARSRGHNPKTFPGALEKLILGQDAVSESFFAETKTLAGDYALPFKTILPLFLLSLFDYLESYYLTEARDWAEDFAFILTRGGWAENKIIPDRQHVQLRP